MYCGILNKQEKELCKQMQITPEKGRALKSIWMNKYNTGENPSIEEFRTHIIKSMKNNSVDLDGKTYHVYNKTVFYNNEAITDIKESNRVKAAYYKNRGEAIDVTIEGNKGTLLNMGYIIDSQGNNITNSSQASFFKNNYNRILNSKDRNITIKDYSAAEEYRIANTLINTYKTDVQSSKNSLNNTVYWGVSREVAEREAAKDIAKHSRNVTKYKVVEIKKDNKVIGYKLSASLVPAGAFDKLLEMDTNSPAFKEGLSKLKELYPKALNYLEVEDAYSSNLEQEDLGLLETAVYGIDKIQELFNKYNNNSEQQLLANKVFEVATKINAQVGFLKYFGKNRLGRQSGNKIEISKIVTAKDNIHELSRTLLHETIHIVTADLIDKFYSNKIEDKELKSKIEKLISVYEKIKDNKSLEGERGIASAKEMVAEMANPEFRAKLKDIKFYNKIIDYIKDIFYKLFNINRHNTTSTDSIIMHTLEDLLSTYDYSEYNTPEDAIITPIKDEFKGKLIIASSGSGKTSIADNITVIDGDYILSTILGVDTALVPTAFQLSDSKTKDKVIDEYRKRIEKYIKEGRTVISASATLIDIADYVVYSSSIEDVDSRRSTIDRIGINSPISKYNIANVVETTKNKNIKKIKLEKGEVLADIILKDKSFRIQNSRVQKADSISSIVKNFLNNFDITVQDFENSNYGIDFLERVIYAYNTNTLLENSGEYIAFMMQYNPVIKNIIAELAIDDGVIVDGEKLSRESLYKKNGDVLTSVYKKINKNKYFKIIGSYIKEDLIKQYNSVKNYNKLDDSAVETPKTSELLNEVNNFFEIINNNNIILNGLSDIIRRISINVLYGNKAFITPTLLKPGDEKGGRAFVVNLEEALDNYPYEKSLIFSLAEDNIVLAGSAAMAPQVEVFRPIQNPLHDLDFQTSGINSRDELESIIFKKFPNIAHIRTIENADYSTESYVVMNVPFERVKKMKNISKIQYVDPITGKLLAVQDGNELIKEKPWVEGKILDFFIKQTPVFGNYKYNYNGKILELSDWRNAVIAKLDYARFKDMFDYNRIKHKKNEDTWNYLEESSKNTDSNKGPKPGSFIFVENPIDASSEIENSYVISNRTSGVRFDNPFITKEDEDAGKQGIVVDDPVVEYDYWLSGIAHNGIEVDRREKILKAIEEAGSSGYLNRDTVLIMSNKENPKYHYGMVLKTLIDRAIKKKEALDELDNISWETDSLDGINISSNKMNSLLYHFNPVELLNRINSFASLTRDIVLPTQIAMLEERINNRLASASKILLKSKFDKVEPEIVKQAKSEIRLYKKILNKLKSVDDNISFLLSYFEYQTEDTGETVMGIDAIKESLKDTFKANLELAREEENVEVVEKIQKVLDHFDELFKSSISKIGDTCGFTTTTKITTIEDSDDIIDENSDEISDESETKTNVEYNIRKQDIIKSMSKKVRKLLSGLKLRDDKGEIILDDLGNEKTLNPKFGYVVLLNIFDNIIDSEDFATYATNDNGEFIKDENGFYIVDFPKLSEYENIYTWIPELKEILRRDPNLACALYSNCKMHFLKHFKMENGREIALNEISKVEAAYNNVKNNYESGIIVGNNSVYGTSGEIIMDNVKANLKEITKVISLSKYLNKWESNKEECIETISEALKNIGITPNIAVLNSLSYDSFINVRSNLYNIFYYLSETDSKRKKEEADTRHIVKEYRNIYNKILEEVAEVSEFDHPMTFRYDGETRNSYTVSGYLENMSNKMRRPDKRQKYINELRRDITLYDETTGWTIPWLNTVDENTKEKYEDDFIFDISNMETVSMLSINGKSPEECNAVDLITAAIKMFKPTQKEEDHFYVTAPLLSDAPVLLYVKVPKIDYEDVKDVKSTISKELVKVVEMEMKRMALIEKRKENGAVEITNYDNNGSKFCFFPELNSIKIGNESFLEAVKSRKGKSRNSLIQTTLISIIDNHIKNLAETIEYSNELDIVLKEYYFELGSSTMSKEELKNFKKEFLNTEFVKIFYNDIFARINLKMMLDVDQAYFQNPVDSQKRQKQYYSTGKKIFVGGPLGKKVEKSIIISDNVGVSTSYTSIMKNLDRAVQEGRISEVTRDNIGAKFRKVNATDGQTLRTAKSMHSIIQMLGKSNDGFEQHYQRLLNDTYTEEDTEYMWNTVKAFVYGPTYVNTQVEEDGYTGELRVMQQHKNSEFVLLSVFSHLFGGENNNSPIQKALDRFMTKYDIDKANYESSVKVGSSGIINLNYSPTKLNIIVEGMKEDGVWEDHIKKAKKYNPKSSSEYDIYINGYINDLLDGTISQDTYNAAIDEIELLEKEAYQILEENCILEDGSHNPNVVHSMDFEYWTEQQPNDSHLVDTEIVFPTQFNTLITADLPEDTKVELYGKILNRDQIITLYNTAKISNVIDSGVDTAEIFKIENIEQLSEFLQRNIEANPKYSDDIKSIAVLQNGEFKVPLHHPAFGGVFEEITTSIFRNNVTRQKIKGGYAAVASNVGLTNKLKLKYDKEGNLIGIPCYIPAYCKEWILKHTKNVNGKQEVDITSIPEELRKIIGIRIPTEDNYSMLPLIVEGFLPAHNGNAVMLPADVTTLSGMDFDIDKLYMTFQSFTVDDNGEYVKDMVNLEDIQGSSKEARDNMMIDLAFQILTSKYTAEKMHNPGNFDSLKLEDRKSEILSNPEMQMLFMGKREFSRKELKNKLDRSTLKELDKVINTFKNSENPMTFNFFIKYHAQNNSGKALVGPFAASNSLHAKLQHSNLRINKDYVIVLDGRNLDRLDPILNIDGARVSKVTGSRIGAATDVAKDPSLTNNGYYRTSIHIPDYLSRIGFADENISRLLNLPIIKDILKDGGFSYSFYEARAVNPKDPDPVEQYVNNILKSYSNKIKYFKNSEVSNVLKTDTLYSLYGTSTEKFNDEDIKKILDLIDFIYQKVVPPAEALRDIGLQTKADTKSGGLDPYINKCLFKYNNRYDLQESASVKNYPILSADMNMQGNFIVSNNYIDSEDKKELLENYMRHPVPQVQAFYTEGVEKPLHILGDHFFIEAHKYFMEMSRYLHKYVFKQKNRNNIQSFLFKEFYNYMLLNSNNSEYAKDYNTRKYFYIHEFPFIHTLVKQHNPQLNKYLSIPKINPQLSEKRLGIDSSTKMDKDILQVIQSEMLSLLYSNEELTISGNTKITARDYVIGLYLHAMYTRSLGFGTTSYGKFFSSDFIVSLPNINNSEKQILKHMPSKYTPDIVDEFGNIITDGNSASAFVFQFIINNAENVLRKYDDAVGEHDGIAYFEMLNPPRYIVYKDAVWMHHTTSTYFGYKKIVDINNKPGKLPTYVYGATPMEFLNAYSQEQIPEKYTNINNWWKYHLAFAKHIKDSIRKEKQNNWFNIDIDNIPEFNFAGGLSFEEALAKSGILEQLDEGIVLTPENGNFSEADITTQEDNNEPIIIETLDSLQPDEETNKELCKPMKKPTFTI